MTAKKLDRIRAAVIKARDQRQWTNYKLAKEAGIDVTQLSRWLETGRLDHRPHISTETLEPILAALDLKIKPK